MGWVCQFWLYAVVSVVNLGPAWPSSLCGELLAYYPNPEASWCGRRVEFHGSPFRRRSLSTIHLESWQTSCRLSKRIFFGKEHRFHLKELPLNLTLFSLVSHLDYYTHGVRLWCRCLTPFISLNMFWTKNCAYNGIQKLWTGWSAHVTYMSMYIAYTVVSWTQDGLCSWWPHAIAAVIWHFCFNKKSCLCAWSVCAQQLPVCVGVSTWGSFHGQTYHVQPFADVTCPLGTD